MKWDRSKKKKFPSIEIEMSSTNHSVNNGKTVEGETSIPMFQVQWSSKQNIRSPSPSRAVKEHSFNLCSGDSGIESVQVCTCKTNYMHFYEHICIF